MMRISREEEHYIGRARPSLHGRLKVGFTKEGKVTAVDMFVVMDNGPYDPQGDANQSGRMVSLMYQPPAMRFRGIAVLTNTPPRTSQSAPGGYQPITLIADIDIASTTGRVIDRDKRRRFKLTGSGAGETRFAFRRGGDRTARFQTDTTTGNADTKAPRAHTRPVGFELVNAMVARVGDIDVMGGVVDRDAAAGGIPAQARGLQLQMPRFRAGTRTERVFIGSMRRVRQGRGGGEGEGGEGAEQDQGRLACGGD